MESNRSISRNIKLAIAVIILMILIINFETAQQLYYIKRFNLVKNATFLALFKFQFFRWTVWVIFAFVLFHFIKNKDDNTTTLKDIYQFMLLIIGLVMFDITIISLAQMSFDNNLFNLSSLLTEYLPFFIFQKGPMFTLGYIALTVIFHYYFKNKQLQFEVLKLEGLKTVNSIEYEKLKNTFNSDSSFLKIKIGNKQKIIPVDEINWIEADDYCAKIHTMRNTSYSMRISLKRLESKLNLNFLRVHRKAIVNMEMVSEFQNNDSCKLILNNLIEVPVSKNKLKKVKEYYN